MIKISVILTTVFKKRAQLQDMLRDLSRQTVPVHEIFITFQRSSSFHYAEEDIKKCLGDIDGINVSYQLTDELGISKGRNNSLERVSGDWFLIADDDCRYPADAIEKIGKAIREHPQADVLTFCSERKSGPKKFRSSVSACNRFSIMSTSSIEIVFNRRILNLLGKKPFDEKFGLGGEWQSGEEQVFLSDMMAKGGKILFVPEFIVSHPEESSGFRLDSELVRAKGAVFRRVYGLSGAFLAFLFVLKKVFERRLDFNLFKWFYFAIDGFSKYKR